MRSVASINEGVARVEKHFGRLDILVNNAGLGANHPALEVTEKDWDELMDVNLKGLFFCAQSAARGMVQRVATARAVLHDPELLLADEPRANLDPGAVELMEPLLAGRTRVLTSHDPAGGLAEADLALGLRGGRVALLAPARDLTADQVRELYR